MLFNPKLIEGVDIDPQLIKKAQSYTIYRNSLIKVVSTENNSNKKEKVTNDQKSHLKLTFDYFPISCPLTIGSVPIIINTKKNENELKLLKSQNISQAYIEKEEGENSEIANQVVDLEGNESEKVDPNSKINEKEKIGKKNSLSNGEIVDKEKENEDTEKIKNSKNLKRKNEIENDDFQTSIFPNNITFRVGDWVNEPKIQNNQYKYDIILG